jgi:hypothetical protein
MGLLKLRKRAVIILQSNESLVKKNKAALIKELMEL